MRKVQMHGKDIYGSVGKTKPVEEALLGLREWLQRTAEPCVWTERMLTALVEGVRGDKWFSLMDKVYARRTLSRALHC